MFYEEENYDYRDENYDRFEVDTDYLRQRDDISIEEEWGYYDE